jgi:PAS domain-containing protein
MDHNQTHLLTSRDRDHGKKHVWTSPAAAFMSDDHEDALDSIFFQFAEKSRDGIVFIDREGRVSWLNERIEDLFGLQRKRVVGTNAIIFLNRYIVPHVTGWEHFADHVHDAYAKGRDVKNQYLSLVDPKGNVNTVAFGSFIIHDGSYRGWRIDLYRPLDGSEKEPVPGGDSRRRAVTAPVPEESGESGKGKDVQIGNTSPASHIHLVDMPDFILRCDGNLDVVFANQGARALFGNDPAPLQSLRLSEILTPDSFRRTNLAYRDLIEGSGTDTVRRLPWECRRHDGSIVRVEAELTAVWSPRGPAGITAIACAPGDGRMERAVMFRVLDQIEKNMEQFAMLNDQIRNPLQVIVGLADLSGGDLADRIFEQANRIDEIVRELDRGWMVTFTVRESLRTLV